ncbi:hypothetical protein P5V15_010789 [Pogonomyrmex californicus]
MTIRVQIVILHTSNTTDESVYIPENENENFFEALKQINDIKIYNLSVTSPVKTVLTNKLLAICDCEEIDLILIIGNVETSKKDSANEAISVIMDHRPRSNIAFFIRQIETTLKNVSQSDAKCGIRNEKLIINLSGPHKNKKKCLNAIAHSVGFTIFVIRNENNTYDSLIDIASSLRNISSEKEESKNETDSEVMKLETTFSSHDLSSTDECTRSNRNNYERFPMVSLHEALTILNKISQERLNEQYFEQIKINNASGRILCENIKSEYDIPSFRTSTKHGYAILAASGKGFKKVLNVKNTLHPVSLTPGTCVWVNSGAPVPDGATAVVAVKDTKPVEELSNEEVKYIEIITEPLDGQNIKFIGSELMKGATVVFAPTRIGPGEMALIAASGRKEVTVSSKLSLGVLSIGDNLEESGEPLKPGYVYDTNRLTLISLLQCDNFFPLDFGIVKNKLSSIRNKIEKALEKVDVLVTTGSINDKDVLKQVLMTFKATIHFGNVNIKPGKSTTLATCKINNRMKYFLCLSGNPVSAYITANMFLVPFVSWLSYNFTVPYLTVPLTHLSTLFMLHSRPRFALTRLHWNDGEYNVNTFNMGNVFTDKLYNIIGSNALLFLPSKTDNPTSRILATIIKYPEKFDLPSIFNKKKKEEFSK